MRGDGGELLHLVSVVDGPIGWGLHRGSGPIGEAGFPAVPPRLARVVLYGRQNQGLVRRRASQSLEIVDSPAQVGRIGRLRRSRVTSQVRDAGRESVVPLIPVKGSNCVGSEIKPSGVRQALEVGRRNLSRWREEDERCLKREVVERNSADVCKEEAQSGQTRQPRETRRVRRTDRCKS